MTPKTKRPAYQFYPGDEERDMGLRSCSLEAYGLWKRMLNVMHDAEPYGHLVSGGRVMEIAELARFVGAPAARVKKLLQELEDRKVFSRTADGVIYSRRMVRDEHIRTVRAAAGSKGGNPNLKPPPDVGDASDLVKQPEELLNQTGEQNQTPAVAVASASALRTTDDNDGAASGEPPDTLDGRLPVDAAPDLAALLNRVRNADPRRWRLALIACLDGMAGHRACTPAQMAKALAHFALNGATVNWKLFDSYLAGIIADERGESTAPGAETRAGRSSRRANASDLKGAGILLFGTLRGAVREVYRAYTDGTEGGYRAKEIAPQVLEELPPPARTALEAIGGARAVIYADEGKDVSILQGRFADAYAAAAAGAT